MDITALHPSEPLKTMPERVQAGLHVGIVLGVDCQHADAAHLLALLRGRRKRPRGSGAAEQRDELAPPHGSVMPVWSFMDDFPANHSHCSRNVAEPSVINGERIGGQDSEVRQLAGLK